MADFSKGPNFKTPFGTNEFLRSTQDVKTEHYTFSMAAMPSEDVDGTPQKMLRRGVVCAKITSGPEAGKVGVFQAGATDGRQTAANIVGLNHTFAPWQLLERDIEVGVVVEARVVQAWCFEYDADGDPIPLTNATRDALDDVPGIRYLFT